MPIRILPAEVVYAGTLLALLGPVLGAFIDYRVGNIVVQPDSLTNIPGTPYAVRLDAVADQQARVALPRQTETVAQGSIGVERSFGDRARLIAAYVYRNGTDQLRARATNLPGADGTRPDLAYGNITVVDSTGGLTSHALNLGGNVRFERQRLFLAGNDTLGRFRDDGNGPLSLPSDSVNPDEWGPARSDVHHRVGLFGNLELPWSLRLGINLRAESCGVGCRHD